MTAKTRTPGLPIATTKQAALWIRSQLAREPWRAALAVLFAVVGAAAILVPVYVLGRLVDDVLAGADTSVIGAVIVQILLAALAAGVLAGAANYLISKVGETVLANLRERALEHALLLPLPVLEKAGKGDLLSRINEDVAAIAKFVSNVLPAAVFSLTLVALSYVAIFSIDYRIGLGASIAVPFGLIVLWVYLPRVGPTIAAERVAMSARSQALVSGMQGLPTVHAYGLENDQLNHIDAASQRARARILSSTQGLSRVVSAGKIVQYIGLAVVFYISFVLIRDDQQITVGEATIVALLFYRLFAPMQNLLFSFNEIQAAVEGIRRLVGLINSEMVREKGSGTEPQGAGLELENLQFSYDGHTTVLHDVSISIAEGERVALVGSTGAGKTTVAAIAAGTLKPDRGQAKIGGVDLSELGSKTLRKHVAIISQEVHVFSGPLFEDLRLANPFADHDALHNALHTVGALHWVENLPEGIATMVGEGGYQLTAAQAQQVALARLVLADPAVAILDEATAEAGSAGAHELEHFAYEATQGRTALIVAHRLTQAARADRVVVLERGRVIEDGPHAKLLKSKGRYAELWSAWEGRAKDSVNDDDIEAQQAGT
ncbi:ABC transporter ATP-binding protein [Hoyosella rhizosphaerae]|uniref:ABC transporter permease n=1 Tax=Hoyosella rhizosphaerae TaxID=1755582 RepID=A0A916UJ62_9ACTN|nr:ABC transporter ATP-binding protein [Hoyosella rhizosphaerae]MBN4928362.1 ABC transporter ATP-binding protein [Hoyosella rhizosphaerae]GGC74363.1 ABC transporter permease [Hoyosella rhizosphaerae]